MGRGVGGTEWGVTGHRGYLLGHQYDGGDFGGYWGQRLRVKSWGRYWGTWGEEGRGVSAGLAQYWGCRARALLGCQGPGGHWRADAGVHSGDQEGTEAVAGVPVGTRIVGAGPGVQGAPRRFLQ